MKWAEVSQGPKGWGWGESFFHPTRMGQDKTMQDEDEGPIFQPHPAPLSSLI